MLGVVVTGIKRQISKYPVPRLTAGDFSIFRGSVLPTGRGHPDSYSKRDQEP